MMREGRASASPTFRDRAMRRVLCLAAIVVATANCGSSTLASTGLPTTSTTTSVAPTATTESFTGTVQTGGSDFKPFTTTLTGQVNIILTAAGPPATIFMG